MWVSESLRASYPLDPCLALIFLLSAHPNLTLLWNLAESYCPGVCASAFTEPLHWWLSLVHTKTESWDARRWQYRLRDSLWLFDGICCTDLKFASGITSTLIVRSGLNTITNDQGGLVYFYNSHLISNTSASGALASRVIWKCLTSIPALVS